MIDVQNKKQNLIQIKGFETVQHLRVYNGAQEGNPSHGWKGCYILVVSISV